jgi:hypothetical protein
MDFKQRFLDLLITKIRFLVLRITMDKEQVTREPLER